MIFRFNTSTLRGFLRSPIRLSASGQRDRRLSSRWRTDTAIRDPEVTHDGPSQLSGRPRGTSGARICRKSPIGSASRDTSSRAGNADQHLRSALHDQLYDPYFSYLVFDTLFAVNDRWEPRPQMIDRWDRSADGMTWTFALREGLSFHDGSAVTSEDCTASLRRWGKRDALGGLLIGATKTLEPIDARQFQLQLREPFGFVLDALAKPGAMVPMI